MLLDSHSPTQSRTTPGGRRRTTRSPRYRSPPCPNGLALDEGMTDSLQSPVKIDSPGNRPTPLLFPDSPRPRALGNKDGNAMRGAGAIPATAPAGDRWSKFDLSTLGNDLLNIDTTPSRVPVSSGNLFHSVAPGNAHPASDPFPVHPLGPAAHLAPSAQWHPRASSSASFASTSELLDEDSPFVVPATTTARRAHSLKHQRSQPPVDVVPSSASHGTLPSPAPIQPFTISQPCFTVTARSSAVSVSSGATLEMLDETNPNDSFEPREPVYEAVPPPAPPSVGPVRGPVPAARSRSGSFSRIPVAAQRKEESLARARKVSSMLNLVEASAIEANSPMAHSHPLASSRKRNANGAIVGGGGARSRLANLSPFGPPSSQPATSSPSISAMRDSTAESDDEDDAPMRPPPPVLKLPPTSGMPRSRASVPSQLQLGRISTAFPFSTPGPYRLARPLAEAFLPTGLVSKRARATDPGPGLATQSPNPFFPAPSPREVKPMPDTPCKRPAFLSIAPDSPALHSPLSPQQSTGGPIGRLVRTASSSSTGSLTSEPSPTAIKAASMRKVSPLFRRRSSGNLLDDGEPCTPTRAHADSPPLGRQLVGSPDVAPSPESSLPRPAIFATAPRSSVPVSSRSNLTMTPFQPRASHPPHAGRPPNNRHRSSNDIITIRQIEQATPSRYDRDFIVLRPLGKGVSSDASAVEERETGMTWAIKRTRTEFVGSRDRIRRLEEVDALRTLMGHRHIVLFRDAWEHNQQLFIQTELCDGGTLARFLDEYGQQHERLDEARVWKILAEVADGLTLVHAAGYLHLDLKPANIFLSSEGECKIGDFGLATRWPRVGPIEIHNGAGIVSPSWDPSVWASEGKVKAKEEETTANDSGRRQRLKSAPGDVTQLGGELEREGDREYIAPEVLAGRYGPEADIFSLGMLILEAAANVVVPDNGAAWQKLRHGDFSDVSLDTLSPALVALLTRMLAPEPDDRISAADICAHPVVVAARRLGGPAVVEEDDDFLERILTDRMTTDDAMEVDEE